MPYIAIRLREIMFFEFFDHYFALYLQTFFTESKRKHPVAFQPESCFQVIGWYLYIIISEVIGGVGIILPAGHLQWLIITGNIHRTSKHQVFEQMSKPCSFRILIPGTYIIQDIHHRHWCAQVLVNNDTKTVG